MAYSVALNTVYNHYLATYPSMRVSKYDTHKKSELRGIYHSIIKLNKESPLFLIDNTKESREFAVNLKENARQFRNTVASLGGLEESGILNKKTAYSSNSDIAAATFTGDLGNSAEIPSFDLSVKNLASEQINLGNFLPTDKKISLPPDSYSFDIGIGDFNYEFLFGINDGETNADVQNRLARLFNNAEIGLSAEVVDDGNGNSALRLISNATGISPNKENLFHITDDKTSKTSGAVSYLGLNTISQKASNAVFLLNGEERTSLSNHFTVHKMYELQLNGVSRKDQEPVHIGLKTDTESINENITSLIDGYNSFIRSSSAYPEEHSGKNRFLNEMKGIVNLYHDEMESLGLAIEDGHILLEDNRKLAEAFLSEGIEGLSVIKDFTNAVLRKTNQISLNPMEYVDKKLVTYKNPGHNFVNPYITSAYSGMMFNSYC